MISVSTVQRIHPPAPAIGPGAGHLAAIWRTQALLAACYLALLLGVSAISSLGLGAVARPLYMLSGLVFAWITIRRSPWLYLSAALWFWLFTAFARRIIEWKSGFNPTDPVLATPVLITLFMGYDILTTRGLLARRELGGGLLVAAAVLYGTFASTARGAVVPGLVASADWMGPLFAFFYINANAGRIESFGAHLRIFVVLNMAVIIAYSLYQYFYMPAWDANWIIASGLTDSIGKPLPMAVRVFGPTNISAFLAAWLAACVLLAPALRSWVASALVPFAIFLIFLTLVRSTLGGLVAGLFAGMLIGGAGQALKSFGLALLAIATLCVGLAVVSPKVATGVMSRLESIQDLQNDDSARVRTLIYRQMPALIDAHPFGTGIGAQGRGAAASSSGSGEVTVDSGPLAIYLALGWVVGTLYLLGMVAVILQAAHASWRSRSPLMVGLTSAAVSVVALLPFTNVINFAGVLLWFCLGAVIALGRHPSGRSRSAVPLRHAAATSAQPA